MDFLNKKSLTYSIIFIFILLALLNLTNINDNSTNNGINNGNNNGSESFIVLNEDQNLSPNVKINIPSTDLVQFNSIGTSTIPNNLTTILNSTLKLDSNNSVKVTGNLILEPTATVIIPGWINISGSGADGVGSGSLGIINNDKTGRTEAHMWRIYNMRNYGTDISGPGRPGNGLSFWKYSKDDACTATNSLCQRHMTLNDDGTTFFAGEVICSAFNLTSWGMIKGGRVHIYSTVDEIYLMPKSTVVILRDPAGWGSSGNLTVEGHLLAKGGFTNLSDRRTKENIQNISKSDKDKVLQLVPKTYNLINEKNKRYGLIAQEVEELYPELVSEDNKGMKSLNYIELIPLLLEQIKELKKTIPNQNVINIGGVTLNSNELLKLKHMINNYTI
jgi:hypothetical protein